MRWVNTELSWLIKTNDLLVNLEVKANSGDLSNDNHINILNTFKKSISFVVK